MNDERLGKEIGDFYRETDVTPPDSKESAREVATRLPRAQQVKRRRWLPTWLTRSTHQPSPIPAANGHTPTVIGRTQSMFSPAKAITAGALVFAIGGVLLIAQPFDQQGAVAPGAETDDPAMAPSFFTGTIGGARDWVELAEGVYEHRDDGVVLGSGGGHSFPLDSDDPRFSGRATTTGNWADYREGATTLAEASLEGIVSTNLMRLVNDGGAWEGEFQSLGIDDLDFEHNAGWLTGSGDYEGLSAYFVWDFPTSSFVGHITAEGPPPAPEGLPE